MIDAFLTSPDDLPPDCPRRARGAAPSPSDDTALAQTPVAQASNVSRTALAAGMLLAATVVGNPTSADSASAAEIETATPRAS